MNAPSVFLSYSHEDRAWAQAFAEALKHQGLSLSFDEWGLNPGDQITEAMERALRDSQALIFLLGPKTVAQPSLFFEIGAALALRKRMIPVVSNEVERSRIPGPLRHVRSVVRGNPEETAAEVAKAVA